MNASAYDLVKSEMQNGMEISRKNKVPKPDGAIDFFTFKALPIGTRIWMVWELGPQSSLKIAETRKVHSKDHKNDHRGEAFIIDWTKQFPISVIREDRFKDDDFVKYATEYYSNYNLSPDAYNDSYIFLNEQDAKAYLDFCRTLPRFRSEEDKLSHDKTMKLLDDVIGTLHDNYPPYMDLDSEYWD